MYAERLQLVVPAGATAQTALAATSGEHGKLEVYSGTKAVKDYGITVQGSGTWASGEVSGSLTTYDYKALYQVYGLDTSVSADYWFVSYHKDTHTDELKKVAEHATTLTTNYDVKFEIQGNDYGVNAVFITFEVIRLTVDGVSRDFVVTNSASAGANNANGTKYSGGFKPQ